MQRIVIPVSGVSNNIGAPTVAAFAGVIAMVQFALRISISTGISRIDVQLAFTPVFTVPIVNSGQNPQEIALCSIGSAGDLTPGQAYGVVQNPEILIPCNANLGQGVQLFVNGSLSGAANAVDGNVIVFVE